MSVRYMRGPRPAVDDGAYESSYIARRPGGGLRGRSTPSSQMRMAQRIVSGFRVACYANSL